MVSPGRGHVINIQNVKRVIPIHFLSRDLKGFTHGEVIHGFPIFLRGDGRKEEYSIDTGI